MRILRFRRGLTALGIGLVVAAAAMIGAVAGAQATAVAHGSSSCSISKVWHKLGPSYVEQLAVSGTTCANAEAFVTAYNNCRIKAGGVKGRCSAKVDGFRCSEKRYSSPDQFIGKVTCTKPREAVDFTYSEDT